MDDDTASFNDQITVEAIEEPKGIAKQNALKGQHTTDR